MHRSACAPRPTDELDQIVAGTADVLGAHARGDNLLGPAALMGLARLLLTAAELGLVAEQDARRGADGR
jgi:hypothetical protein